MYYFLGALVCSIVYVKDKKLLTLKLDSVTKFLTLMSLAVCFRLAIMSLIGGSPTGDFPFPLWMLIMVWWEDAVYAIPVFYISESSKIHRYVKFLLILVISLYFGLGHSYQGLLGIAVTSLYPYFISARLAKQHGFGTVMLCHVLYDIIIVVISRLAPYIAS